MKRCKILHAIAPTSTTLTKGLAFACIPERLGVRLLTYTEEAEDTLIPDVSSLQFGLPMP